MDFIGQNRLLDELDLILPGVDGGENVNLLFRARSGYGKTTLGLICLIYLGNENSVYYLPDKSGDIEILNEEKRIHFIDEAHLLKEPEHLYPYMDSGRYTFILASNESGSLKEPLINRCIPLVFDEYTDEEFIHMVKINLDYKLSDELIHEIYSRSKRNPRTIKITCTRLSYVFTNLGTPDDLEHLIFMFEKYLGIFEDGLTQTDFTYLNFLESAGGRAGLNTIVVSTGIDKYTVMNEIEPYLIISGRISLTPRGRILN